MSRLVCHSDLQRHDTMLEVGSVGDALLRRHWIMANVGPSGRVSPWGRRSAAPRTARIATVITPASHSCGSSGAVAKLVVGRFAIAGLIARLGE